MIAVFMVTLLMIWQSDPGYCTWDFSIGVVFGLAVTQTGCAQGFLTSSRVFDNLGQWQFRLGFE